MTREYVAVSYYYYRSSEFKVVKYFQQGGKIYYAQDGHVPLVTRFIYLKSFINAKQREIRKNTYPMRSGETFVHGVKETAKCLMMLELMK